MIRYFTLWLRLTIHHKTASSYFHCLYWDCKIHDLQRMSESNLFASTISRFMKWRNICISFLLSFDLKPQCISTWVWNLRVFILLRWIMCPCMSCLSRTILLPPILDNFEVEVSWMSFEMDYWIHTVCIVSSHWQFKHFMIKSWN